MKWAKTQKCNLKNNKGSIDKTKRHLLVTIRTILFPLAISIDISSVEVNPHKSSCHSWTLQMAIAIPALKIHPAISMIRCGASLFNHLNRSVVRALYRFPRHVFRYSNSSTVLFVRTLSFLYYCQTSHHKYARKRQDTYSTGCWNIDLSCENELKHELHRYSHPFRNIQEFWIFVLFPVADLVFWAGYQDVRFLTKLAK